MFLNYLKVGLRNILKYKGFSFINIFGLAAAMSVCMLIIVIIADQKGYDRWQANSDRIYRVHTVGTRGDAMHTATSALPLAANLRKGFPGIEATAVLVRNIGGDLFYKDKIAVGGGYFTDGNLFRTMDYALERGDARTALEKPFTMVISAELAAQLFPREEAIGKTIRFTDAGVMPGGFESGNRETAFGNFMITGVLRPNPGKTSLPFQLLASLSTMNALGADSLLSYRPNDWGNVWNMYTYVRMEKGRSKADLQRSLDKVSGQQYPKGPENPFAFQAVGLTEIVPGDLISNPSSASLPRMILLVLGVLCLIVMLSACLNYTNLSIARLLNRAREVGVRKVSGATRRQIFTQFISEAMLMSLFSLLLAFGLLLVFQHLFSALSFNKYFNITFEYSPRLFLVFLGFSLLVGFVAGVLPSLYISFFNPIDVLKGLKSFRGLRGLTVRKVLLVVQFCVSLIFIISTSLIYLQGKHVLNFDYGFNKANVVNIKLFKTENYDRYVQAISANRKILAVAACTFPPATGSNYGEKVYTAGAKRDSLQANYLDVDAACLRVWDLQLVAGRNLPAIPADKEDRYILVNERMVADLHFGSPGQAVGQHLVLGNKSEAEIIGVVKDFQFLDVSRKMEPLMLRNRKAEFGYLTVRVQGQDLAGTVAFLQDTWKKVNPASKFEYGFLDEQMLMTHTLLSDVAGILGVLAFLAVVISSLGLLGMATYTAETRRKEVSLRKVLGSSVSQLMVLLSRGFLVLVGIAVVIAVPVAYFVNGLWLNFFASRVAISVGLLLVDIGVLIALCMGIVFSQAWRVATASPAKSLRAE
jgi:putative ABC transport system permease protein